MGRRGDSPERSRAIGMRRRSTIAGARIDLSMCMQSIAIGGRRALSGYCRNRSIEPGTPCATRVRVGPSTIQFSRIAYRERSARMWPPPSAICWFAARPALRIRAGRPWSTMRPARDACTGRRPSGQHPRQIHFQRLLGTSGSRLCPCSLLLGPWRKPGQVLAQRSTGWGYPVAAPHQGLRSAQPVAAPALIWRQSRKPELGHWPWISIESQASDVLFGSAKVARKYAIFHSNSGNETFDLPSRCVRILYGDDRGNENHWYRTYRHFPARVTTPSEQPHERTASD